MENIFFIFRLWVYVGEESELDISRLLACSLYNHWLVQLNNLILFSEISFQSAIIIHSPCVSGLGMHSCQNYTEPLYLFPFVERVSLNLSTMLDAILIYLKKIL